MITERTLRKWRMEALQTEEALAKVINMPDHVSEPFLSKGGTQEVLRRILRMTQELLDQHLLRKR